MRKKKGKEIKWNRERGTEETRERREEEEEVCVEGCVCGGVCVCVCEGVSRSREEIGVEVRARLDRVWEREVERTCDEEWDKGNE